MYYTKPKFMIQPDQLFKKIILKLKCPVLFVQLGNIFPCRASSTDLIQACIGPVELGLDCIYIRTRKEIYGKIKPSAWGNSQRQTNIFDIISRVMSLYRQYNILNNFLLMIPSLISLTISPYTPLGVYCEIYPSLEGNKVE